MIFKVRVNFGRKLLTQEHTQITAQHTVENDAQAEKPMEFNQEVF